MQLSSLSQDILQEILKHLTLHDINNLIRVCTTLYTAILEDRYLWHFVLNRDIGHNLSRIPTNAIPAQDAPVGVLRAWVKHAHALWKAYQIPSSDRAVIRINTPARVTFVKLVRGRWFFVASSDTTISELSVWEILSSSTCALRNRVYLPAPVLDGILDDGGSYIRLAITVGTCHPSISILELAKDDNDEVILVQHAEIVDASHVLYLKGSALFFSCLHGDDTWPVMMDWMNGMKVRLAYLGRGGVGDSFPLPFEHCAGLYVWKSYILLFAYSGLHIFTRRDQISTGMDKIMPINSLALPQNVFKTSFLDELETTSETHRTITNLRWVAQLENTNIVIIELTCAEEGSIPRFGVDMIFNARLPLGASNSDYATDYAVGCCGGHITWISVSSTDYIEPPAYTIAPIRSRGDPSRTVVGGSHISIEDPKIIPSDGLPFSCLFPCLDFDDGHGILLIGSDAGQFCLVIFANALLPDEAVHGDLPSQSCADVERTSKIPLELDIPAYYSYRYRPEYESEERPAFAVEDAVRLWGESFANHPLVPGWSNDWSEFLYLKDWILPLSVWSMHDSDISEDRTGHRIRARLYSVGEIIPILYDIRDHARVIFRMGNRVLYCRTFLYDEYDSSIDATSQSDALGALSITYKDFMASDSDTILALIHDREARTNLEERYIHESISRKEYSAKSISFALKEAASIGRIPDKKTLEEWTEDDWVTMDKKFARLHYGVELSDEEYTRFVSSILAISQKSKTNRRRI